MFDISLRCVSHLFHCHQKDHKRLKAKQEHCSQSQFFEVWSEVNLNFVLRALLLPCPRIKHGGCCSCCGGSRPQNFSDYNRWLVHWSNPIISNSVRSSLPVSGKPLLFVLRLCIIVLLAEDQDLPLVFCSWWRHNCSSLVIVKWYVPKIFTAKWHPLN